jgi:hypothetical protein
MSFPQAETKTATGGSATFCEPGYCCDRRTYFHARTKIATAFTLSHWTAANGDQRKLIYTTFMKAPHIGC